MEQLELKHLAPYLPYGLKVLRIQNYPNGPEVISRFNWGSEIVQTGHGEIINVKPILRPLSDLTKEIENLNNDDPLQGLYIAYINGLNFEVALEAGFKHVGYGFVQWLFENHFDVFGLIEKGLAIDINTL